jgi:hypothetical protein
MCTQIKPMQVGHAVAAAAQRPRRGRRQKNTLRTREKDNKQAVL